MRISDQFCTSICQGSNPPEYSSTQKKISQSALPILCAIGTVLLSILPLPGSTFILAGGVVLAACFYEPPLHERPLVLPALKPLYDPATKLRLNIRISNGGTLSEDAPRGIKDQGGNSWLNAGLQLLESSSTVMHWLKEASSRELSPFRDFFRSYHDGGEKPSSDRIRKALLSVCPLEEAGMDPSNFLTYILEKSPKELKNRIRQSSLYSTIHNGGRQEQEIKEIEIPLIHLPIRGVAPQLEKMLQTFQNEKPIGLKLGSKALDGKNVMFRVRKIERRFCTAPPDLWVHISRFENVVQKSIFNEVPFLKSIFPPIAMGVSKNNAPVSIPHQIEIHPQRGRSKKYRLNGFIVHEGTSPQENRVKAYRYKNDILYRCNNEWIVKVSYQAEQEILSQAYLLHYEPV